MTTEQKHINKYYSINKAKKIASKIPNFELSEPINGSVINDMFYYDNVRVWLKNLEHCYFFPLVVSLTVNDNCKSVELYSVDDVSKIDLFLDYLKDFSDNDLKISKNPRILVSADEFERELNFTVKS